MSALDVILSRHEPYPAVAVDRVWNLVAANSAMLGLTEGADIDPELLEPPINVIRLGLHPRGLGPLFVNLGDWHAHWLKRLERQLAATGDEQLGLSGDAGGDATVHGICLPSGDGSESEPCAGVDASRTR